MPLVVLAKLVWSLMVLAWPLAVLIVLVHPLLVLVSRFPLLVLVCPFACLSTRITCLPTRSICLSIHSTRSTICWSFYSWYLTFNDLYDATCMTHNRFSDFYWVYTIIQVVHTAFIKVALTEYSACKSSSKMIKKQVVAAVIIALTSKKNKSMKKKKRKVCVKTWLKRRKIYETPLEERS